MIEIRHLRKEYANVTPIRDLNAVINDGDVVSVIGPSGCGKSTLLRCLNRMENPTSGQVLIDGLDYSGKNVSEVELHKKMGMVFQSFNLFEHKTVIENIMMPQIDILGRSPQEAYDKAIELLKTVGLREKLFNKPGELSGGQKQRIAICRALAMDPEILLFDEPTSALDPTMVDEVQSVIMNLAKSGKTMLIVTHEMNFARRVANRVFYLDEGGLYEDGTPEQIFDNPQREKTRNFVFKMRTLSLEIGSADFDLYEMNGKIYDFCLKSFMGRKEIYSVQAVFEELCKNILVKQIGRELKARVILEHSAVSRETVLTVLYNGGAFHPMDTDDAISRSILKGNMKELRYETLSDGFYSNKVVILF